MSREKSKQIIAYMALHHAEVVSALLASMPFRIVVTKRHNPPNAQGIAKLITAKRNITINQLIRSMLAHPYPPTGGEGANRSLAL
jgi:hypothetical protein